MTRNLLSCRKWFLATCLARSGIWGSVCLVSDLFVFATKNRLALSATSKQSKTEREKVREQIFCLHCLHLCSSVHNKSAQWLKSSYLWNSNKKDSLCEHVIFEWIMIQSPGFKYVLDMYYLIYLISVNPLFPQYPEICLSIPQFHWCTHYSWQLNHWSSH